MRQAVRAGRRTAHGALSRFPGAGRGEIRLMAVARDAVIVGGGHNGLVAAAYLARSGLDTLVCERRDVVGGAAVSEHPFGPGYTVPSLTRSEEHQAELPSRS